MVEADEYRKSFLHLVPRLVVITNIDVDHLDFYQDLEDIQMTFAQLVHRVPHDGFVVCDPHDDHVVPVLRSIRARVVDYRRQLIPTLSVPGSHNRANAMAAAAAAQVLGVPTAIITRALQHFPGTWRRFQYKGKTPNGALVYDDYAHNPQKVAAAIAGARELYPKRRIVTVFQPHLFSRTKHFLREFAEALTFADEVVLLPIYAAREMYDPNISSETLVATINNLVATHHVPLQRRAVTCNSFDETKKYLDDQLSSNDVVIIMGAGNSTELAGTLVCTQ